MMGRLLALLLCPFLLGTILPSSAASCRDPNSNPAVLRDVSCDGATSFSMSSTTVPCVLIIENAQFEALTIRFSCTQVTIQLRNVTLGTAGSAAAASAPLNPVLSMNRAGRDVVHSFDLQAINITNFGATLMVIQTDILCDTVNVTMEDSLFLVQRKSVLLFWETRITTLNLTMHHVRMDSSDLDGSPIAYRHGAGEGELETQLFYTLEAIISKLDVTMTKSSFYFRRFLPPDHSATTLEGQRQTANAIMFHNCSASIVRWLLSDVTVDVEVLPSWTAMNIRPLIAAYGFSFAGLYGVSSTDIVLQNSWIRTGGADESYALASVGSSFANGRLIINNVTCVALMTGMSVLNYMKRAMGVLVVRATVLSNMLVQVSNVNSTMTGLSGNPNDCAFTTLLGNGISELTIVVATILEFEKAMRDCTLRVVDVQATVQLTNGTICRREPPDATIPSSRSLVAGSLQSGVMIGISEMAEPSYNVTFDIARVSLTTFFSFKVHPDMTKQTLARLMGGQFGSTTLVLSTSLSLYDCLVFMTDLVLRSTFTPLMLPAVDGGPPLMHLNSTSLFSQTFIGGSIAKMFRTNTVPLEFKDSMIRIERCLVQQQLSSSSTASMVASPPVPLTAAERAALEKLVAASSPILAIAFSLSSQVTNVSLILADMQYECLLDGASSPTQQVCLTSTTAMYGDVTLRHTQVVLRNLTSNMLFLWDATAAMSWSDLSFLFTGVTMTAFQGDALDVAAYGRLAVADHLMNVGRGSLFGMLRVLVPEIPKLVFLDPVEATFSLWKQTDQL